MAEIYTFASEHPVLTFFLFWMTIHGLLQLIIRFYRMVMVMVRGWPPEHLDADGDWKPEKKED